MNTRITLLLACVLSACGHVTTTQHPLGKPSGVVSIADGIAGYQHGLDRSRFSPGNQPKRTDVYGFTKTSGNAGTFAVHTSNGAVLAIPNAEATAILRAPYGKTPDDHNERVKAYFIKAGIPEDQIAGVHVLTMLQARGIRNEAASSDAVVSGYYSVLERGFGKVHVVDSFAWASIDEAGEVIAESVYWPAIPRSAVAEARRLEEIMADPVQRQAFLDKLPTFRKQGDIVIRHASATIDEPLTAFGSFDVSEPVRGITTKKEDVADKANAHVFLGNTVVRHFGADARERRLPQEQRNLGQDVPGQKAQPPQ